jgi:hypothetical protein
MSRSPCRVVTTSADYSQLEAVLWGELRRFIQTSRLPLDYGNGGPLIVNHMYLRKVIRSSDVPETWGDLKRFDKPLKTKIKPKNRYTWRDKMQGLDQICGLSYVIGRVAAKGEGMLGHHIAETGDGIPRTLWVADEASGVEDEAYERATTWAKRMLVIGNAYQCGNFFKRAVKQGDVIAKEGQ